MTVCEGPPNMDGIELHVTVLHCYYHIYWYTSVASPISFVTFQFPSSFTSIEN